MFRRALLLHQTRQFARGLAAPGPVRIVCPARQCQWQASSSSLRRSVSTESKPAGEAASADAKAGDQKPGNGSGTETGGEGKVDTLQKELDKKTEEARDFKVPRQPPLPPRTHPPTHSPTAQDKFTRTVADFRNLQDRTERDKKAARDFAIQKFAKDLVDSVDNLDRALSAVPEDARSNAETNKDLVDLYNGLKMTESILLGTLRKHGLEKIDPIGELFDPNRHEATFQTPVPGKEPNTVFLVQQTGFVLNGRTIRVRLALLPKRTYTNNLLLLRRRPRSESSRARNRALNTGFHALWYLFFTVTILLFFSFFFLTGFLSVCLSVCLFVTVTAICIYRVYISLLFCSLLLLYFSSSTLLRSWHSFVHSFIHGSDQEERKKERKKQRKKASKQSKRKNIHQPQIHVDR